MCENYRILCYDFHNHATHTYVVNRRFVQQERRFDGPLRYEEEATYTHDGWRHLVNNGPIGSRCEVFAIKAELRIDFRSTVLREVWLYIAHCVRSRRVLEFEPVLYGRVMEYFR